MQYRSYESVSPLERKCGNGGLSHQISIDVVEKKLAYPPGKKIPKEVMAFAKTFLRELDEEDYTFLWSQYVAYKSGITEKANPDEIEGKIRLCGGGKRKFNVCLQGYSAIRGAAYRNH